MRGGSVRIFNWLVRVDFTEKLKGNLDRREEVSHESMGNVRTQVEGIDSAKAPRQLAPLELKQRI